MGKANKQTSKNESDLPPKEGFARDNPVKLRFPQYRGRRWFEKLGEKLEGLLPADSTARGLVDDGLTGFDSFVKAGSPASAKARKIRTAENEREWRDSAQAIWRDELKGVDPLSTVGQVAIKICEGIPLSHRPAPGTVKNAIKGVKSSDPRRRKQKLPHEGRKTGGGIAGGDGGERGTTDTRRRS